MAQVSVFGPALLQETTNISANNTATADATDMDTGEDSVSCLTSEISPMDEGHVKFILRFVHCLYCSIKSHYVHS